MRKFLLPILLFASLLGGCATQPPLTPTPALVAVPAPAPAPDVPAKPHLAVQDLPADATADAVVSAYASSLKACVTYSKQLLTILDGYGTGD